VANGVGIPVRFGADFVGITARMIVYLVGIPTCDREFPPQCPAASAGQVEPWPPVSRLGAGQAPPRPRVARGADRPDTQRVGELHAELFASMRRVVGGRRDEHRSAIVPIGLDQRFDPLPKVRASMRIARSLGQRGESGSGGVASRRPRPPPAIAGSSGWREAHSTARNCFLPNQRDERYQGRHRRLSWAPP
jgi:hypothetical protein